MKRWMWMMSVVAVLGWGTGCSEPAVSPPADAHNHDEHEGHDHKPGEEHKHGDETDKDKKTGDTPDPLTTDAPAVPDPLGGGVEPK